MHHFEETYKPKFRIFTLNDYSFESKAYQILAQKWLIKKLIW